MDMVLNILTLGLKPLYERQWRFHRLIMDFRERLSRIEEVSLTEDEIDAFYRALNTFDFRLIFFSSHYKKYIENLNRFKPEPLSGTVDLTFLKIAIAEDKWKPTSPKDVFAYHMRYKNPVTSKFFIAREKKRNHKKLNAPKDGGAEKSKFDPSKKWTRVPIGRNSCKPGCGCSH